MKIPLKYICVLLGLNLFSKAQLLVSTNNNALTLVNQIVGKNVTITNAVLNCGGNASGLFIANNSNIGLNNGILLTTGKATNAMGPNNVADKGDCINSSSSFYDPQISSIDPKATYDGCVLEFDIKPICNTLQIRYVFGSEEYPEFVGSQFNDVFGFFIWGPNPLGGTYNGNNIARLPNSTQVAINNINNGSNNTGPCNNCGYYINNTGGTTIQYDGFTSPLTASVNVQPCQTYHLKLAIADAGDCDYDSGVFLEYEGISCDNAQLPTVTKQSTAALCDLNNGTAAVAIGNYTGTASYLWTPGGQTTSTATGLAPGIYNCQITFNHPCPYIKTYSVQVSKNIGFTVNNTVTNIKCPQDNNGSATVTPIGGIAPYTYSWNTSPPQFSASAINLGLGTYVATITDANGCVKRDSVRIFATTNLTLSPTSSSALCNNATGTASANIQGGVAPYSINWNTIPIQTASIANNLLPGNYSVTVTDADGCIKGHTITVNNFYPTIIPIDSVIHSTCNQANGAIYISGFNGGLGPYTYTWSNGPNTSSITGIAAGTYTLSATDVNNCPSTEIYTIHNYTTLPIFTSKKDDRCQQRRGEILAQVLGGTAPVSYTWSNGFNQANNTGLGAGTYSVYIQDAVGCSTSTVISIQNYDDVFNGTVNMVPRSPSVNQNVQFHLSPTSLWNLDFGGISTGQMIRDTVSFIQFSDYGWYYINYFLVSTNGCKSSVKFDFFIKDFMTLYFPNTFTPNEDGLNDIYLAYGTLVKVFKMQIYDRWGELLFSTDDLNKGWNGTYKAAPCKEDTYIYKARAEDYFGKSYDYSGHINLIR